MHQNPVIVLDNGAYTAKLGLISGNALGEDIGQLTPFVAPNCLMKVRSEARHPAYIADQIGEIKDLSSLYYQLAFQKGYLIHWDIQKQVWDRLIHTVLPEQYPNHALDNLDIIITVPPHNLPFIESSMNEIFFEEYNLSSCLQLTASDLSALHYFHDIKSLSEIYASPPCSLIVDTGYSFTHLSHYVYTNDAQNPKYSPQMDGARMRRIDVGGKLLTNYLKDIISYRQLHVMDETYVINQVKEDVCFVAQDFIRDMETCKKYGNGQDNPLACQYVLPDFQRLTRGYIRSRADPKLEEDFQVLSLSNERISVPELLFNPSDVGIDQMGLPEAIIESIGFDMPTDTTSNDTLGNTTPYCENIVLTGGNASIPGISQRLSRDLRGMLNAIYTVKVYLPPNPDSYAWQGGCLLASQYSDYYDSLKLRRKEYQENGAHRAFISRRNKL